MSGERSDEQFYDEEIAPQLAELAKKCGDRDIPFIAFVEADDAACRTVSLPPLKEVSPDVALVYAAVKAKGNLDAMAMAVSRLPHAEGHNSIVLSMLGGGDNE